MARIRLLGILTTTWFLACASTPPLPPRAAQLNQEAVTALTRGDLETADARLGLALEYSPKFVEAWVNLGLVEVERGNFLRARRHFERALRLNPDVAQPHHGLGVLEERQGHPDRASEAYQDALAVDPGFLPARLNWARLLFAGGFVEHARIQLRKALEVAPDDPRVHAALAEVLIRVGRVVEADMLVERARRAFPNDPAIGVLLARCYLRHGAIAEALALLLPHTARRDEMGVSALGWMATGELMAGHPRKAIGAAQRALRMDPQDPIATHAMALALTTLEDSSAAPWRAKALHLAPKSAALLGAARPPRSSATLPRSAQPPHERTGSRP